MHCSECMLCYNQKPLLDTTCSADVVWVGLSSVRVDDVETSRPLSSDTRTGSLVEDIEAHLPGISFYHTNLVKCLPESQSKVRYPTCTEMKSCFPHLENEVQVLSPRVVLLLGKQVANYVLKQFDSSLSKLDKNFNYNVFMINGVAYVPIHHPSFMLIYQRRNLESYVDQICRVIRENLIVENDQIWNDTCNYAIDMIK